MASAKTRHQLTLIGSITLLLMLILPVTVQARSGSPVDLSPGKGSPQATSSPSIRSTSGKGSTRTSPTGTSVTISSTVGWQTTPLTVQQGTLYSIAYISGTWTVDHTNYAPVDPDGYPPDIDKKIYQGCKYDPTLPYATLLGQIGSGPAFFKVGSGGTFTAGASGVVSLRINDADACLGDNAGSIVVSWLALLPGLRLPWDRTLTNIPLTSGPHSNIHANQPCVADPISILSGLDFGLKFGTDVLAAASGTIFLAQKSSGGEGPYIVGINHGGNFATEYWHMSVIAPSIKVGVKVTQGTLLGQSGQPVGGAPHLHLEFRTGAPGFYTPYSAQGMLIDGYQAWTEALGSVGKGLNYEGTMTRGAALLQPYTETSCNGNPVVTQWYTSIPSDTIYAQSNGSGGDLVSSNSEIRLSGKTGKFFYNPNDSGTFDVNPSTPPVFTQSFATFFFNPPPVINSNDPNDPLRVSRQTCIESTGVDETTRPFTDVTPNPSGICTLTIVQGNGVQAGVGNMSNFEAVFTPLVTVPYAGHVIFHIYADDGWIVSIGPSNGQQPIPDSGNIMTNPPPGKVGPFTGYPEMGDNNVQSMPTQFTIGVTFPAAGTYPVELDYTECCQGTLTLVVVPGYQ